MGEMKKKMQLGGLGFLLPSCHLIASPKSTTSVPRGEKSGDGGGKALLHTEPQPEHGTKPRVAQLHAIGAAKTS